MSKFIKRFIADESGATTIEYGMIAAFISIMIVAGLSLMGPRLNEKFDAVAKPLT